LPGIILYPGSIQVGPGYLSVENEEDRLRGMANNHINTDMSD
jgi:hypothetical protein